MVSHGQKKKRKKTEKKNVAKYKTQFNQGKALSMKVSWVWAKLLYKHLTLNIIQCLFQYAAAFFT